MGAEPRERHQPADPQFGRSRHDGGQAVRSGKRPEVHEDVGRRQVVLDHPEQVAAAADRGRPATLQTLHGVGQACRIHVGERSHASASSTRSRVIGSSRSRRPVALNTALPMAATTGMIGGSPTFFAPYGP